MSFHPWFPRDSIDSLCSWQPGVSKVTPVGRIRTTDLPDRVKLAAQRKASCNICEQSQTLIFSAWLWALWRPCLSFPFFFLWRTLDRNLCSTVVKCGYPGVSTHVRAATVRHVRSLVCGPAPLFAPVCHSKSAWHSSQLRSSHRGIRRLGNLSGFERTAERGLGGES